MFRLTRQTNFCLLLQIKCQPAAASPRQVLPASSWLLPVFAPTSGERAHEGPDSRLSGDGGVLPPPPPGARQTVVGLPPCFSSVRTLPFAGVCTAAYLADTHTHTDTHALLTCLPYRLTQERVARPPERGVFSPCLYKLPRITAEGFFDFDS